MILDFFGIKMIDHKTGKLKRNNNFKVRIK